MKYEDWIDQLREIRRHAHQNAEGISINPVTPMESSPHLTEGLHTEEAHPNRPMMACERGNWIDTEGTISLTRIDVSQREREPLENYCEGARRDGIPCNVEQVSPIEHRARIFGIINVAKEIALTRECIRTKRKKDQIERFTRALKTPRLKLMPEVREARKILGIPERLEPLKIRRYRNRHIR